MWGGNKNSEAVFVRPGQDFLRPEMYSKKYMKIKASRGPGKVEIVHDLWQYTLVIISQRRVCLISFYHFADDFYNERYFKG